MTSAAFENATTLFICRHGERVDAVDASWARRTSEPWDPPLSERGREQVRVAAHSIARRRAQHIIASPLRRTIESAEIAAEVLGLSFDVDDGLLEWQNPDWFPGLTTGSPRWLQSAVRFSGRRRSTQPPRFPETEHDAMTRCLTSARVLAREYCCLLLIGHENGVTSIVSALSGTSIRNANTGALFELTVAGRAQASVTTLHRADPLVD